MFLCYPLQHLSPKFISQSPSYFQPYDDFAKYYEAVYLMRQYMSRIPTNHSTKNRAIYDLLQDKIAHYETVAAKLLHPPTALSPKNEKSGAAMSDNLGLSHLSIQNGQNGSNDDNRSPLSNCDIVTSRWNDQSSPTFLEQRNPKNSLRAQSSTHTTNIHNEDIHYLNQQGNLMLSQAIDEDERIVKNTTGTNASIKHNLNSRTIGDATNAISKYMEAAELYLKAIRKLQKLKKSTSTDDAENTYIQIDSAMKQKLQQTLDRVETLKRQQRQTADKRVPATSQQLEQDTATTTNSMMSTSNSTLSASEVQVLQQSSSLASGLFLPWSDSDATHFNSECSKQRNQKHLATSISALYTDPDGFLALSKEQKEHFFAWARPSEIIRIRQQQNNMLSSLKLRGFLSGTSSSKDGNNNIVVMRSSTISPHTIQQKYITECSFISGLCVCANYERKFHKPLVTSILYPQAHDFETDQQLPIYNPSGKYMIKLWLNGIPRCVLIDDYLPIDKHGNLLCSQTTACTTSNDKLELWVCLIEKAYMKLCGGYSFPGCNSGIDMFSLTGWIPEQIYFASPVAPSDDHAITTATPVTGAVVNSTNDHEIQTERAWERIYSASSYGDCLISVSTTSNTNINREKANNVGLVSGHAYAVLSVIRATNGTRLLQLKNPWAQPRWKGRYSCYDVDGWNSPRLRSEVGYDPVMAKKQDDGIFWICWDDILHYFQEFYLLWNPTLFSTHHVLHGHWSQNQGPTDDTFNVGENPQHTVTLSDRAIHKRATLWILISRHVTQQEHENSEV